MATIVTVGHGTRTLDELVALLEEAGVTVLVDVRRHPGSRRHPQHARSAYEQALPAHGIDYRFWGETLGGRRSRAPASRHTAIRHPSFQGYADWMDTATFRSAILDLETLAERQRPAVLCAETVWWRCHRRHIADALVLRGNEVLHALQPGDLRAHPLHPDGRAGADGWPVYDLGDQPLFDP